MKAFVLPIVISSSIIGAVLGLYELKEKTAILIDDTKLTYQVDEKNQLNGLYTVINTSHVPLLRGSYKDDKRSGNWYCFNNDKSIFLRYNYDSNKILALDTVNIKKATIKILSKDKDAVENASISLPICSIDQYISLMNGEIKKSLNTKHITFDKAMDFEIKATLNEKNKVQYKIGYLYNKEKYEYILSPSFSKFNIDWIPAMYKGNAVPSEFTVYSEIKFAVDYDKQPRFNWSN
jgi:hypothetical protein